MDAAAKYCLESLCVVLDTDSFKHTSCDDESASQNGRPISVDLDRVLKYYDRKGFDIILPGLDISKLPNRNLEFGIPEALNLPKLTVIYDGFQGKKIFVRGVRLSSNSQPKQIFGYDAAPQEFDAAKFIHHNVRCLVAEVYDQFYFFAEGEAFVDVFDYAPQLTNRMVDKVYELVKKNFAEAFQLDEEVIDMAMDKEKDALERKLVWIRDVLVEKGLDNIVMDWPTNASSDGEILEALYGDYLLVTPNLITMMLGDEDPNANAS
ncbi:MAG: hypothetical protein SGARI_003698 [Bacillariaceae sp.]